MDKFVTVLFALPEKQWSISVKWQKNDTIHSIIHKSGVLNQCTEIDLDLMSVGIFGKITSLETVVNEADRVEIYRPLLQNPMDARRNRALK